MRKQRVGIKVTKQHHDWDCGVAALAMLLSKPYGDIAALVREHIDPVKLRKRGTIIADLEFIAALEDIELKRVYKKKGYLEEQTGILGILGGVMDKAGHWVVIKDGSAIIDPDDGSVWSLDDYLVKHKCRTVTLLVPERK